MLGWAIAFLVVSLIAGALGFGLATAAAFAAAKIIFVLACSHFLFLRLSRSLDGGRRNMRRGPIRLASFEN
jgi:uncharacterized membrane protein YtjA (UPF0391 family)